MSLATQSTIERSTTVSNTVSHTISHTVSNTVAPTGITMNNSSMLRSETFKIAKHRTPWVLAAVYSALVLAAPAFFVVRPPQDTGSYLEAVTAVFAVVGLLIAPIFGAWLVGNEYRHGTLRRVLAVDARRGRLLATKAALGLGATVLALAVVAGIGLAGAAGAAAVHGDSLVTDGLFRSFVSGGFVTLVAGVIAFGLSVAFRSDTYAMLGSLSLMVVFGPILMFIPTVGKYTPFAVTSQISERIEDASAVGELGLGTAIGTLAAMLLVLSITASQLFVSRDV